MVETQRNEDAATNEDDHEDPENSEEWDHLTEVLQERGKRREREKGRERERESVHE